MRIRATQTFISPAYSLTQGEERDVPAPLAEAYIRDGLAKAVDPPKAPRTATQTTDGVETATRPDPTPPTAKRSRKAKAAKAPTPNKP